MTVDFRQAADSFNAERDLCAAAVAAVQSFGGEMRRQGHDLVGPCPLACGGEGDDRFVVFGRSKAPNNPVAWCRKCGGRADALALSFVAEYGRRPGRGDLGRFLREHGYLGSSADRRGRRHSAIEKPKRCDERVRLLVQACGDVAADEAARQLGVDLSGVLAAARRLKRSARIEILEDGRRTRLRHRRRRRRR